MNLGKATVEIKLPKLTFVNRIIPKFIFSLTIPERSINVWEVKVKNIYPAQPEGIEMLYQVVDSQNGKKMKRNQSLHAAHRIADRLDSEYGAVRYVVKPEREQPEMTPVSIAAAGNDIDEHDSNGEA